MNVGTTDVLLLLPIIFAIGLTLGAALGDWRARKELKAVKSMWEALDEEWIDNDLYLHGLTQQDIDRALAQLSKQLTTGN